LPTPEAEAREDEVIEIVLDSLVSAGVPARITDRPDRSRNTPGYTVDAELEVNGVSWALDVMTLRWNSLLESRVARLEKRLIQEFAAPLEAMRRVLSVTCHPPRDLRDMERIVTMARNTVDTSRETLKGDEGASLYARPSDWPADLPPITVSPFLGEHAQIRAEIVSSSGESLAKKLNGQLARARLLGKRIGLAIDQRGSSDLKFGANWMAHSETIAMAIQEVEQETARSLDFLAIAKADNTVEWLRTPT
jgi:hypothetical protein